MPPTISSTFPCSTFQRISASRKASWLIGRERQTVFFFTRLQIHFGKPHQFFNGTHHACRHIMHIKLHDFCAGFISCVAHMQLPFQYTVGLNSIFFPTAMYRTRILYNSVHDQSSSVACALHRYRRFSACLLSYCNRYLSGGCSTQESAPHGVPRYRAACRRDSPFRSAARQWPHRPAHRGPMPPVSRCIRGLPYRC